MADLKTHYLGLPLRNPLIVSSSGLTDTADKIRRLAELGAGAVVVKSLFEEQIRFEAGATFEEGIYPEASDYILGYSKMHSLDAYLKTIEDARKDVDIPVIASINCMSPSEWLSFAREIEAAGADALELNVFFVAHDKDKKAEDYEKLYAEIITRVKENLGIPVSVKIGSYFTNLVAMVNQLYFWGVKGVVLFNRFFEPDIDIDQMKLTSSSVFSHEYDLRQSLRWVGMISDRVKHIDIAASTGVHSGKAVIKQLLAGAKAVQICSVLYQKGVEQLPAILGDVETWMEKKGFETVEAFRGMLSYGNIPDPAMYERSQFMKYFSSHQ